MGIYQELEVPVIINAAATLTRLGGSRMSPEVLASMNEAAQDFVHISQLQQSAGEVIAAVTGAEAGYVVSGAAAGLTMSVAACVAGLDVAKMDRLPDLSGMKNEIVVQRGHRNFYDHAIRAVGVKFVEVGVLGYPGAGGTYGWQLEDAIGEQTAAVACPILPTPGTLSLPDVAEIAHRHGVPVVVDAAAELPPRANLQRFIQEGADLVVFSGGKSIGGPQSSGIVAGRADLIQSIALQHQDMDVRPETWTDQGLIQDKRISGVPTQGFGRGFKVGREEIAGLVTALKIFAAGDDDTDISRWNEILDAAEAHLAKIDLIEIERLRPAGKAPQLWIKFDGEAVGISGYEVVNLLLQGEPRIAAAEGQAEFDKVGILPQGLTLDEADAVGKRLVAIFASSN